MNRVRCIQTEKGNYVLIDLSNITDFEAFKLILFCRRFIDSAPKKTFSIMLDLSHSDLSFNTQMTLTTIFEKFQSHLKKSCVIGLRTSENELSYLIRTLDNSIYTFFDNRTEAEEYLLFKSSLTA